MIRTKNFSLKLITHVCSVRQRDRQEDKKTDILKNRETDLQNKGQRNKRQIEYNVMIKAYIEHCDTQAYRQIDIWTDRQQQKYM